MMILVDLLKMKDKSKHGIDFKERAGGSTNVMKPENVVGKKLVMNRKEMNKALAVHNSHNVWTS